MTTDVEAEHGPNRLPEELAEGVRTPDTYSAADAARVLGVSERRVRQLVGEGRLPTVQEDGGPVRLPQQAVHEERDRRRRTARAAAGGSAGVAAAAGGVEVDVQAVVDATLRAALPRMLEASERAEQGARDHLQEERALRMQAEARVVELEVRARMAEERLTAATRAEPVPDLLAEAAPIAPLGRKRRWWKG